MSKTVAQIYAINPTTTVADTDLYYLVQSPYTPGTDAAITGASLKAIFGTGGTINPGLINQLGYYAAAGSTISGLATLANGALITSAAGAPSISQTLPATVQGNITSLGTISSGVWNGTVVTGTFGGTGVNNGTSTITIGGNFAMSGAFTFTGTITGNTGVTFPTSGTLATTSQLITSPLTTKGDLWGFSTVDARLPVGSINGQILQVASGATLGLAYSTATYPSTALSAARILRSDGTNYVDTTSTFADTYAASSVLYANGVNNVAGLTTANNGTLVTNATGVPSMLAGPGTTGNFFQSNAAAAPSWSASTITLGGNFTMSGAFTFTGTVTGNTAVTFPISGTLATTSQLLTSPLTTKGDIWVWSTTNDRLPIATGDGKILQVSSGAATGLAYSTPTYPSASGSAGVLLRSDGTNNVYTTSTYPATNAINTLLYASSANVMTALATVTTAVLTTSAGVPTWANQLSLTLGGTNASLTASNGGIFYSTASAGAILAGTATAGLALLSGASTTPSWSTSPPITRVISQVFTGNGTYTPTSGMVYCITEAIGGGGAGGGAASSVGQSGAGGGGGSGGYSRKVSTAAAIGASQTVTIGAGGTAGTTGANAGNAGGDTSLGTICIGKGGSGGGGGASATGSSPGAGGIAGTGDFTAVGEAGNGGMPTTVVTIFALGGRGGNSVYGGGGSNAVVTSSGAGTAASNYGSGGAGGVSWNGGATAVGGIGSAGVIIITEYVSV